MAVVTLVLTAASTLDTRDGWAGEEDDLQRQIETQRSGIVDIERLDELHAAGDEIILLKSWCDEAWNLRAKHEYDQVREVLDRALGQAELIRQKINVSKLRAQVEQREAALKDLRLKIDKTRRALQDTAKKKKTLEGAAK
jgi:multidrug resistance efflux pump